MYTTAASTKIHASLKYERTSDGTSSRITIGMPASAGRRTPLAAKSIPTAIAATPTQRR